MNRKSVADAFGSHKLRRWIRARSQTHSLRVLAGAGCVSRRRQSHRMPTRHRARLQGTTTRTLWCACELRTGTNKASWRVSQRSFSR
jgi:hypothetical protein